MKVLVFASSFPSINQPWLDTHIRQLRRDSVDVSVVSFKRDISEVERAATADLLSCAVFLTRDPEAVAKQVLSFIRRSPVRTLARLLRVAAFALTINVSWKERTKIALFGCYLDEVLPSAKRHDLVHVHFDDDVPMAIGYSKLRGLPVVTTFHGLTPHGVSKMKPRLRVAVYNFVERVIVGTEFAKRQVKDFGCPIEKVEVVPQGMPFDAFVCDGRPPLRPGEKLQILSVGRLHRDKGHAYSLLAGRRLVSAGVDFEWAIVGGGPDKAKLAKMAEALGLSARVRFVQGLSRDELVRLYKDCHVFVLASVPNKSGDIIETQGVVLQEAQASGCLVVATRVGGIPECINDGRDAILVRHRSSRAIAEAVQSFIERPGDWAAFQQAAKANVATRFSAESVGRRLLGIYASVLEATKPASG